MESSRNVCSCHRHAVVEELAALGASLRHLILSRTGEANQ
ncbi:hypothetical protein WN943_026575 [Citrus x changshan-huyou]